MLSRRAKDNLAGLVFVGPQLIGMLAFVIGPMLYAIGLSLYRWDLLSPPMFVGLGNYAEMVQNETFWKVMRNTSYYTVGYMLLNILTALGAALALNRIRGKVFFRTLFFMPVVTSAIAVSLIWLWMLNPQFGVVNTFLRGLGIAEPPRWFASTAWAMPGVILMSAWWNLGYNMVILLAGLQSIPESLYEAAMLDGASHTQRFTNVTLPMLTPTLFFVVVVTFIGSFQVFDQIFIMTNGGPADATRVMVMYIYSLGFQRFDMGLAAAVAMVLFVILLAMTLVQFRLQRRWVFYG
ncbi:MAG: sugar ABC transporter permease [Chloroflexi bacterium]|nr:sugar ABC transporter permease [Chloroflexota bacterium]